VRYSDVVSHPVEEPPWDKPPVVVRLTFDIECAAEGCFPNAKHHPVVCISGRLSYDPYPPPGKDRVICDIIFAWGYMPPAKGYYVVSFYEYRDDPEPEADEEGFPFLCNPCANGRYMVASVRHERRMLKAFHAFLQISRASVITGHNITGFDVP
jgi:DNA polymerase elongation subunit (family B)